MSKTVTAYFINDKYNYPEKFRQAMIDGNIKYIESLIKRGKVIPSKATPHYDSCGNFAYATIDENKEQ